MRSPDPAIIVCVVPIPVGFKLFRAPNRFVKVFDVILESLCQVTFAIADPGVNCIGRRGGDEFPVAGVLPGNNQFRGTTVAQSKTRRVGINSRGATIAHGQTDAPVARHVDSVKPFFLRGHGCFRRVEFEVAVFAVKLRKPDRGCAFHHADRDAFVAQSDDAQD